MTVIDRIREQASRAPEHPALLVDDGQGGIRTVSAGELVGIFEAHAKRLRAEGVRPADRCGLLARQGRGFIELALGILASDACLVPIPDDHRGAVFDAFLERAKLHHVVEEEDGGFALRTLMPRAVDGGGDEAFRARCALLIFASPRAPPAAARA